MSENKSAEFTQDIATNGIYEIQRSKTDKQRQLITREGDVFCTCTGTAKEVIACLHSTLGVAKKIKGSEVLNATEECSTAGLDALEKDLKEYW